MPVSHFCMEGDRKELRKAVEDILLHRYLFQRRVDDREWKRQADRSIEPRNDKVCILCTLKKVNTTLFEVEQDDERFFDSQHVVLSTPDVLGLQNDSSIVLEEDPLVQIGDTRDIARPIRENFG